MGQVCHSDGSNTLLRQATRATFETDLETISVDCSHNLFLCWCWISGDHQGVALRVSNHPIVKSLCDIYGGPIVSTSANTQGHRAAKTQWQVRCYFKNNVSLDYITQGVDAIGMWCMMVD